MQLWRKVQIYKGPTWMSEEEVRDHYSRRVAPRVDLMEQLHMQLMQRRRVITLRSMQDFLVEWDNIYRDSSIGVPDGASDLVTDASDPEGEPAPTHEHTSRACRIFRNSLQYPSRGIHFPRLAERVVLHPNIRRLRALCFGRGPADVAKFWRKSAQAPADGDLGPGNDDGGEPKGKGKGKGADVYPNDLGAVLKKLAEVISDGSGKGKKGEKNPDPEECPKWPGVKADYVNHRKRVVT